MAGYGNNSDAGLGTAMYTAYPPLGYQYFAWLESGNGADTQTWYGDDGSSDNAVLCGLNGFVLG